MSASILIIDDEDHFRMNTEEYLTSLNYEVFSAATMKEGRKFIDQQVADIILLDVYLPDGFGPNLLEETASLPYRPQIILVTAYGEIDMAVDAMRKGAYDFLTKPIEFEDLKATIQRAEEYVAMRRELDHYRKMQLNHTDICIGETTEMQDVINHAQRAAEAGVSVLITGETGVGKNIISHAIHQMSPRKDKAFIHINCAGIPSSILESELFGHEPGAFTDATERKLGLMEVADDGILFLDEISTMSPRLQAKILTAIDEKAFRRLGSTNTIHVDVQIIAASNKNLPSLIEAGDFRDDLYYRLKVVDIHLPALRDRKEDIPELVGMFMKEYNQKFGKNVNDISALAMEALKAYDWPGNIRELRHAIERAMLFCDDEKLDVSHLPKDITR